ncbi:hypothetical protein M9Y10_034126 [Tritrichomonas musculus]|uniref:ubiquitinyl hydrolase 1 n=1 Tax=Tritrichomonas musculus TaxID=1915356 RepID=A0ABR2KE16_9EUKA
MANTDVSLPSNNQVISDDHVVHPDQFHVFFQSKLPQDYFSFDKALYFFKKGAPPHQLGGLMNIGYNCYVNAVIQCLAYTPGFSKFCLSMPNTMYQQNSKGAFFLDSFAHIFSEIESNKSMTPTWLLTDSQYIGDTFKKPIQQDAHEYLLALLEVFQKECVDSILGDETLTADQNRSDTDNSNGANAQTPISPKPQLSRSFSTQPLGFDTMIDHFFAGDLATEVRCHNCNSTIPRNTKFYDLTVPIREYDDLQAAITAITTNSEIVISGECENCKETCEMTKTNTYAKFPLVLIITMMRFDNFLKKIEDFFKFQKNLIVGGFKYELYSMILHDGRLINHGHFIAFVMDENHAWYKADDVCIYKIKDEIVMNSCPYVLFYKRIIESENSL